MKREADDAKAAMDGLSRDKVCIIYFQLMTSVHQSII